MLLNALTLIFLFGVASVLALPTCRVSGGVPLAVCEHCKYDLRGHPSGAPCPECNCRRRKRARSTRTWYIKSLNRRLYLASVGVLLIVAFSIEPLARRLVTQYHINQGGSDHQLGHWLQLEPMGLLTTASWALWLLSPLPMFLLVAPLIASIDDTKRGWKVWTASLCAAVAVTLGIAWMMVQ